MVLEKYGGGCIYWGGVKMKGQLYNFEVFIR